MKIRGRHASASALRAKVMLVCRGKGKFYAKVHVRAGSPFESLNCAATAGDVPVPAQAYPYPPAPADAAEACTEQDWVLVLPMADARIAVELWPDGRRSERARINFTDEIVKWQSRLNYRMQGEECARMRDAERLQPEWRYQLTLGERFDANDAAIWRFSVEWAGEGAGKPSIEFLSADGAAIQATVFASEFQRGSGRFPDNVHQMHFSAALPSACEPFFIVARGEPSTNLAEGAPPTAARRDNDNHQANLNPPAQAASPLRQTGQLFPSVADGCVGVSSELGTTMANDTRERMTSASDDDNAYRTWLERQRATEAELKRQAGDCRDGDPAISIVLYGFESASFATETVKSVQMQSFGLWELLIPSNPTTADTPMLTGETDTDQAEYATASAQAEPSAFMSGIRYVPREAFASCASIAKQASGSHIAFLKCGDTLEPDALYEMARAISAADATTERLAGWTEGVPPTAARRADANQQEDLHPPAQATSPLHPVKEPGEASHFGANRPFSANNADETRPLVLFCDEDAFETPGTYSKPVLRGHFDLEDLYSYSHVAGFAVMDRALAASFGTCAPGDEAIGLYELLLRAYEQGARFTHVPKVLHHRHVCPHDERETAAAQSALQAHFDRRGIAGTVEAATDYAGLRMRYDLPSPHPLVSIVIPSKDHVDILDACIRSIVRKSTYDAYEIIVVENNSDDPETFAYYDRLQADFDCVRVVTWPHEFNYAKIVNFGASQANGDYLLFLNNDTEVIAENFIEEMLGFLQRPEVGIVGAKLLFADGLVQHVGIQVGPFDALVHTHQNFTATRAGYLERAIRPSSFTAVTGACQMMRASTFKQLGGYDETFAVGFNDGDFCLNAWSNGLRVIVAPSAMLHHYEFTSRGRDMGNPRKLARWKQEQALFMRKWPQPFAQGDPFTNPNLTRDNAYYHL